MCEHRVFLVIATLKAAASYSGGREGRREIPILYMYIYTYIHVYKCTHMHVCIDIYICICMCVYRYVWICVSIYTHPYVHIHTHVCMCVSSRQCSGVLYQKPLSLHLLWNDLGLSHCAFPIHHADYKLLLRMTHGSNPVTHSQLLTMNKPVSTVTVMWRDREHSPLVTGKVLPPLTESSGGRRPLFYIPSSALCFKRATRYIFHFALMSDIKTKDPEGKIAISSLMMKLWGRKPSWHIPHLCMFLRLWHFGGGVLTKLAGQSASHVPSCVNFLILFLFPFLWKTTSQQSLRLWSECWLSFLFGYFCLKG